MFRRQICMIGLLLVNAMPFTLAAELPREVTSKSTGLKMTLIPAGVFQMGSSDGDVATALKANAKLTEDYLKRKEENLRREQPQHTVQISQAFYAGIYEVTQGEYESVMGANPSWFPKSGSGSKSVNGQKTIRFPVEVVSWFDAIEFCNKLSEKDSLPLYYKLTEINRIRNSIDGATVSVLGGTGFRLPKEAEWEYACRAGTTTPYHFSNSINCDKANVNPNYRFSAKTKKEFLERTTTVGSYQKNPFGLFDMHGNVYEWCEDVYDEKAYANRSETTTDPLITIGSEARVLRGGSWFVHYVGTRSAYRFGAWPFLRNFNYGFRVVRTASDIKVQ